MNDADLADRVADPNSLSTADVRKIVDSVFAAMAEAALTAMKSRSTLWPVQGQGLACTAGPQYRAGSPTAVT